jgi:hypothetical protein
LNNYLLIFVALSGFPLQALNKKRVLLITKRRFSRSVGSRSFCFVKLSFFFFGAFVALRARGFFVLKAIFFCQRVKSFYLCRPYWEQQYHYQGFKERLKNKSDNLLKKSVEVLARLKRYCTFAPALRDKRFDLNLIQIVRSKTRS